MHVAELSLRKKIINNTILYNARGTTFKKQKLFINYYAAKTDSTLYYTKLNLFMSVLAMCQFNVNQSFYDGEHLCQALLILRWSESF